MPQSAIATGLIDHIASPRISSRASSIISGPDHCYKVIRTLQPENGPKIATITAYAL